MLVLGSAIAATVQVAVPRELILSLGQGMVSSILAMMLLAVVVSICSTVDSFFALSFASTFTSGSLLAFLIFGPMIDLKNIGLLLTVFKARAVFYLFALAAMMSFARIVCLSICILVDLSVRSPRSSAPSPNYGSDCPGETFWMCWRLEHGAPCCFAIGLAASYYCCCILTTPGSLIWRRLCCCCCSRSLRCFKIWLGRCSGG